MKEDAMVAFDRIFLHDNFPIFDWFDRLTNVKSTSINVTFDELQSLLSYYKFNSFWSPHECV